MLKLRTSLSLIFKIIVIFASLFGVFLSFFTAVKDGYSGWEKRLLYFTAQSNLFLGLVFLTILLFSAFNIRAYARCRRVLYLLKYMATVMISITFFVFSFMLLPFADESYHLMSLTSILTHFVSPIFAIVDFLTDSYKAKLKRWHILLTAVPPIIYTIEAFILELLNVDFGRGVSYPYYFMDFKGPAGFFGFSLSPFGIGYVYPIIFLTACVLLFGLLFYKICVKNTKK